MKNDLIYLLTLVAVGFIGYMLGQQFDPPIYRDVCESVECRELMQRYENHNKLLRAIKEQESKESRK